MDTTKSCIRRVTESLLLTVNTENINIPDDRLTGSQAFQEVPSTVSDVPAGLGLKAPEPKPALPFSKAGPSQSRQSRLGPGPAQLRPWLFAEKFSIINDSS